MQAIIFSLHTQQPLLATSFQGDPNSDVSYSFIAGSMIRGAIIGRYMKQRQISDLDLNNYEVKRLFFDSSKTQYLNAYLISHEGKRTLPVPRSWFKDKDARIDENSRQIKIYDLSIEQDKDQLEAPKFIGEKYFFKKGESIILYEEKRRINIHNQRDRQKGRSTQTKINEITKQSEGEGKIFRYEAIDAGQKFQAVILCSNDTDAEIINNLLNSSLNIWIGGSQSAGYGHIKIENLKLTSNWNEIDISSVDRIEHDNFTVTLLSDLILRDEWGQYSVIPPSHTNKNPTPLTQELEKLLNTKLKPKYSYASSNIVGGFNKKWGLPLPQVPVLSAGSVFIFENIDNITPEQIQQLENQGIGERRNEGFGRIAINWLYQQDFSGKYPDKKTSEQAALKNDLSRNIARKMADRLLEQKLEQTLLKQIGNENSKIQGNITNSQLSRLQLVARQALSTGDCNMVLSLLDNLPTNAKKQLDKAFIDNIPLRKKLEEWLKNPGVWIPNQHYLTVTVAGIERRITDEIARENKLLEKYTLQLIIALAKKAIKEKN
jgi:CRISPR-associated protein Csx10